VSRPRPPLVAGLTHGVGTSTVATALHGRDGGRCEGSADILVCGASGDALRAADAVAGATIGTLPVLAIPLATPAAGPPRARMRLFEKRFRAVVLLPHVPRWHGLDQPLDEVAVVLAQEVEQLPRPLRAYAAALRQLAAAVLGSGSLDHPMPPTVPRPRTVELWRGLQHVEKGVAPRPSVVATPHPVRLVSPQAERKEIPPTTDTCASRSRLVLRRGLVPTRPTGPWRAG
jgi:hypothetical protein